VGESGTYIVGVFLVLRYGCYRILRNVTCHVTRCSGCRAKKAKKQRERKTDRQATRQADRQTDREAITQIDVRLTCFFLIVFCFATSIESTVSLCSERSASGSYCTVYRSSLFALILSPTATTPTCPSDDL
jgi:hypothetical protein